MPTVVHHPFCKLGKHPAKRDKRNLLLADIIRDIKVPDHFSIDERYPGIKPQMWANDEIGDCVLAECANHYQHFKLVETGKIPRVTVDEVVKEYYIETGGVDSGLVLLDNIKHWRTLGMLLAGRLTYIDGFAQVTPTNKLQVQQTIFTKVGLKVGILLPLSAQAEFNAGRPWSKTAGSGTVKGSWGGHCVFVSGYDRNYVYCWTWGRIQAMTWAWFFKYCDEAYALFDNIDDSRSLTALIRVKALRDFLDKIEGE
jgi:hypothetical protein